MSLYKTLILVFLLTSCSATKLNDSWKNPEFKTFNPKNILVIGVTPDFEARKAFEFQLKMELNNRKINALQSTVVFEKSFQDSKQTEEEIEAQINKLLDAGYDSVLVSLVTGIDENESYSEGSSKIDYSLRKFIGYYLVYQDAYFEQDYYGNYKVYHIETSIYNLKKDSEKTLIWSANYDLVDPQTTDKAIKNYIKTVIKTLEKEKLIPKRY